MRLQYAVRALRRLDRPRCSIPQLNNTVQRYATSGKIHPVDEVVNTQLDDRLETVQSATQEAPSSITPAPPRTQREETIAKAQIVFGSKLVGPQRRAQLDAQSKLVAGILVPPKPEEPDNCCMSGCVNCVWDLYRDEMEEWVAKSAEARAMIAERKAMAPTPSVPDNATHVAVSMDDDGGGSESNWNDEGPPIGDMFESVPIGIRAFMETEKRLKQRHVKEGTVNV